MNVIFLDVDGVINSKQRLRLEYERTKKPHSCYNYPFDEICLDNLVKLVNMSNAKIVITSTWRKNETGIRVLLNKLQEYGLDSEVIGFVPVLNLKRGMEIKIYLLEHSEIDNFVILDDDSDMEELTTYLVKTDGEIGLSIENVDSAVKILSKENKNSY